MLRLQPSEIAITPDDIRIVNERLDERKRIRSKVKLHAGPSHSRDDAITSHSVLPYRVEISDGHTLAELRARNAQAEARARIGLGQAGTQLQSPSEMLTARSHGLLSRGLEAPDTMTAGPSSQTTIRAQLDGQVELLPGLSSHSGLGTDHYAPLSTRLLDARTLSAPTMPQLTVQALTPRVHARLPMSEGAVAFEPGRSEQHIGRRPFPSIGDRGRFAIGLQTAPQAVMNVAIDSSPPPPRDTIVTVQPPRTPQLPEVQLESPETPPTIRLVSPAWPTFNRNVDSSGESPLSSSSSSASEAAVTGRLSPLETFSQQVALAHSRLASQTRQRPARRPASRTNMNRMAQSSDSSARTTLHYGIDATQSHDDDDIQVQLGWRAAASMSRESDDNPPHHQGQLLQASTSVLSMATQRLPATSPMRHQALPMRSHEDMRMREQTSASAARLEPPMRHPIPPRHSSRSFMYSQHIPLIWMLKLK